MPGAHRQVPGSHHQGACRGRRPQSPAHCAWWPEPRSPRAEVLASEGKVRGVGQRTAAPWNIPWRRKVAVRGRPVSLLSTKCQLRHSHTQVPFLPSFSLYLLGSPRGVWGTHRSQVDTDAAGQPLTPALWPWLTQPHTLLTVGATAHPGTHFSSSATAGPSPSDCPCPPHLRTATWARLSVHTALGGPGSASSYLLSVPGPAAAPSALLGTL